MRKILIWRKVEKGDGVDIFFSTDYRKLDSNIQNIYDGICPNWGNKLWFQAIYSEISIADNEIYFRTSETIAEINEKYDLIIYPMANFFCEEHTAGMLEMEKIFSQIKIPVYIIACGVQAQKYDEIDELVKKIGYPASKFIESIYQTGGEFALRGNFTKVFFEQLGFSTAVVTGCPSMYQMGADFSVNNKKVNEHEIKPIINGNLKNFECIMRKMPRSIYIDQDCYEPFLFRKNYIDDFDLRSKILFAYNFSCYQAELIAESRIKMIADMNDWYHYIKEEGFNYSFGNRIHGNIMTILTRMPATVVAADSRTLEMAEFFDIPHVMFDESHQYNKADLIRLYYEADYTKFNQTFKSKYTKFQDFLIQNNIVSKINEHNKFFSNPSSRNFETYTPNRNAFKDLAKELKRKRVLLWVGEKVIDIKNEFKGLKLNAYFI